MKQDLKDMAKELTTFPMTYAGLKDAANAWIEADGKDDEKAKGKVLVDALGECVTTIDDLIAFAGSEDGKAVFGAENAAGMLAHAKEVKAAGGKYCDCPACAMSARLLERKAEILG